MVSLKNIAAECGVSVATVSKALNDHSDIGVATKERIRNKAKEMGYLPNFAAQALKTNRTYNIGVLFADADLSGLTHDHFSHVLDSFKVTAEARGYDITFMNCAGFGNSSKTYLEHARYRGFDGVCIACIDFGSNQVQELIKSELPVVTIDKIFDDAIAVMSDNVKGIEEIVRYVYSQGHRKIAYVHGDPSAVTTNRLASFKEVMGELGLDVTDEYLRECPYRRTEIAYEKTMELLALEDRPTCILYCDDFASLGGISAIKKSGLSIPEDISVAGYDGIPLSCLIEPHLTTFVQDTRMIGKCAAESLIDLIEKPRASRSKIYNISGELYEGQSVKNINK